MGGTEDEVTIRGVAIPRIEKFRALGLIIQEKRDIDEDINKVLRYYDKKGRAPHGCCVTRRSH